MSLRSKLGLEDDEITSNTRIIIIKLEANAPVGILVDEVKEVVTLENSSVDAVSRSSKKEDISFINGIGKNGGTLISLLDLNTVISE